MKMNSMQLSAATYDGSCTNLLVVAGAGTGKTSTLMERISFLIQHKKVPPNRILAITFTNRAAAEMRNRITSSAHTADQVKISTFHAFALSIILNNKSQFPIKKYTIIDADDQISVLKLINAKEQHNHDSPLPAAKKVAEVINFCRNSCCSVASSVKRIEGRLDQIEQFNRIISLYSSYKAKKSYLDFDDLILKVAYKLGSDRDFCRHITSQFNHILIDEFQDINPIQKALVDFFINNKVNMFAVGDDAQSIFGFRSSSFKFIHEFKSLYDNAMVIKLTENYRSGQEQIDISNWLLSNSPINYDKKLYASRGSDKSLPLIIQSEYVSHEAESISLLIQDKIHGGVDPSEILVLSRSSFDTVMLRKELQELGIPYQVIGGDSANKKQHVKDYLSALRIYSNPKDEIAWSRYLQVFKGTGKKKSEKIVLDVLSKNNHTDVSVVLSEHLGEMHPATLIYKAINQEDSTPTSLIRVLQGFIPNILSSKKGVHDNNDFEAINRYASMFNSVSELMYDLTLEASSPSYLMHRHNKVVTLSTIHSAKGTEADICIVAGIKPGSFPHSRALSEEDIEEERRILYVALTRVKKELYLSFLNTGLNEPEHHFFLRDMPSFLVRKIN